MKYTKPSLSFEAQADLLISRGLIADRTTLISRLQCVSYYRLSGYIFPFRLSDDKIKDGTTLDMIWQRYIFDRKLRMLIMDATERIEVATRTRIAHEFAELFGMFGYIDHKNLLGITEEEHTKWIDELRGDLERSKEIFLTHFKTKYDENDMPPIWMLVEIMSFGKTITFYKGMRADVRKRIAWLYGIPEPVFMSWLRTLGVIRNTCAHHTRLWDRELSFKPKLPYPSKKYPQWHYPIAIPPTRIFVILTILRYLLKQLAPTSQWQIRLNELIANNRDIPLSEMGFPSGWRESPLWT